MSSERHCKIYFIEDLLLVDNINIPAYLLFGCGNFIARRTWDLVSKSPENYNPTIIKNTIFNGEIRF